MSRPVSGHTFEAALLRSLRLERGCAIVASDALDERKIDGEIHLIGGVRLAAPVAFQVTTRIDHYTKLRKYLKARAADTQGINLYVEVERCRDAQGAADDLAWAAAAVQDLPPFGPLPVFGLRIGEDSAFFDPWQKLEELRVAREAPARLMALKRGVAHRIGKEGFTVLGEDGGEREAHFIDVDDGTFRDRLRAHAGMEDAEIPVSFLPAGKFALDVRPRETAPASEEPRPTS